jgi:EAL domain
MCPTVGPSRPEISYIRCRVCQQIAAFPGEYGKESTGNAHGQHTRTHRALCGPGRKEGLGVAFTRQVMSSCLACLATLDRAGHGEVAVAMNVPWDWIVDRKNVDELIRLTEQAGQHPSRMIVEIVESAPLVRNAHALRNLNVLRAHGFVLALDDFGTGYSALEHLRYMPLNYIKIAMSRPLPRIAINRSHPTHALPSGRHRVGFARDFAHYIRN